ncbi:hypothetical protein ACFFHF_00635 [Robertmurraya beringensis]|uniref:Type IV pilus assembly protein PilN n=1 Tax=Robertmurraya beringensis TaxID=641660 RepID=A0ABV6KKK8_9BACI
MNFSIDLLPQERRNRLNRLPYLLGAAGLFLVISALLIILFIMVKSSVHELDEKVAKSTEARDTVLAEITARRTGVTVYNFVYKYNKIHGFLSGIYKNPITIKENLYKLLPEGGSVSNYTFENTGSLSMTVLFQTKEAAATYLQQLLEVDFVTEAKVTSISLNTETNLYEAYFEATVVTLEGEQQ